MNCEHNSSIVIHMASTTETDNSMLTRKETFNAKTQGKSGHTYRRANGMGESHARRLVAEGASVVITDLDTAAGEALAAELGKRRCLRHRMSVLRKTGSG